MAKVLRWRASQEVWTAHSMRNRNSDAAPPSVPNYPAQPTAAPRAPASSPTPALVIAARESLDASMLSGIAAAGSATPSPAPLTPPPHP
jgi:hypothetical protein